MLGVILYCRELIRVKRRLHSSRASAPVQNAKESTHLPPTTKKQRGKAKSPNDKEVTSSYRAAVLKPTCSKLLKQPKDGEVPGSVNAYLAMRERQKQNIEDPAPPENPEMNLEEDPTTEDFETGIVDTF